MKKYNAPDDIKKWTPIRLNKIKSNCKFYVLSKVLSGCINKILLKLWLSEQKWIENCEDCIYYEEEKSELNEKKKKTKGTNTRINSIKT